jgi:hypothetical protein
MSGDGAGGPVERATGAAGQLNIAPGAARASGATVGCSRAWPGRDQDRCIKSAITALLVSRLTSRNYLADQVRSRTQRVMRVLPIDSAHLAIA